MTYRKSSHDQMAVAIELYNYNTLNYYMQGCGASHTLACDTFNHKYKLIISYFYYIGMHAACAVINCMHSYMQVYNCEEAMHVTI